jgi:hypothetical protein
MINFSETLEPIAAGFRALGLPEGIVHWGHPVMMGIMVFVVGSFVSVAGWQGKLLEDKNKDTAVKGGNAHHQIYCKRVKLGLMSY